MRENPLSTSPCPAESCSSFWPLADSVTVSSDKRLQGSHGDFSFCEDRQSFVYIDFCRLLGSPTALDHQFIKGSMAPKPVGCASPAQGNMGESQILRARELLNFPKKVHATCGVRDTAAYLENSFSSTFEGVEGHQQLPVCSSLRHLDVGRPLWNPKKWPQPGKNHPKKYAGRRLRGVLLCVTWSRILLKDSGRNSDHSSSERAQPWRALPLRVRAEHDLGFHSDSMF